MEREKGKRLKTVGLITPNRLAAGISLLIHLIVLLVAAFVFIEGKNDVESYVEVDFTKAKRRSKLRRMRIVHAPTIQRPQANVSQKQQFRPNVGTMVDIPVGNADFVLPTGDLSETLNVLDDNMTAMREMSNRVPPLARVVQPKRLPPQINLIAPKRDIITQIESLGSETAELNPAPVQIPTASLNAGIIEPPKFIHKVVPKYPELARRAEKEGIVILEAEISTDGAARQIKVIQKLGYGCEKAAIEALKSSRFLPARRGREPVAVRIQIPYRFQFEE